jgi:hypothetical protein
MIWEVKKVKSDFIGDARKFVWKDIAANAIIV